MKIGRSFSSPGRKNGFPVSIRRKGSVNSVLFREKRWPKGERMKSGSRARCGTEPKAVQEPRQCLSYKIKMLQQSEW